MTTQSDSKESDAILRKAHAAASVDHWHDDTVPEGAFDLGAVERLLFAISPFPADTVKAVRAPESARDLEGQKAADAMRAFSRGHSLILRAVHERHPAVAALASRIGDAVSAEGRINAYVSPPGAQGFATHVDAHDVAIVQTYGHKLWQLFSPVENAPIEPSLLSELERGLLGFDDEQSVIVEADGPASHEFVLESGTCLYVPRGVPHHAVAGEHGSVHLTVALIDSTCAQAGALAVFRESIVDATLSRAWRPGEAATIPEPSSQAWSDVEAAMALSRQRRRRPLPSRLLQTLCTLDLLDQSSELALRPNIRPWMGMFRGDLIFAFASHSFRVDADMEATFSFLADIARFHIVDLPLPSEIDRVEFVRDLVRLGLLECAP